MKAYLFLQRGYRGHYDIPKAGFSGLVVVASSWDEANKKAKSHISFGERFIDSAPPYWSKQDENSKAYDSIDDALEARRGGWEKKDFLIVE